MIRRDGESEVVIQLNWKRDTHKLDYFVSGLISKELIRRTKNKIKTYAWFQRAMKIGKNDWINWSAAFKAGQAGFRTRARLELGFGFNLNDTINIKSYPTRLAFEFKFD